MLNVIKIENVENSSEISIVLDEFAVLLKDHCDVTIHKNVEGTQHKGSLVLELAIEFGKVIAFTAVYDILKAVIIRHASNLTPKTQIKIDGKLKKIEEILKEENTPDE